MTDPKIKYDIEAAVKGEANVQELEQALRELGGTLEGDLKNQANQAADALQALGAKQEAVTNFGALRRETANLTRELDAASTIVDRLGNELPQATAATRGFADAENAARVALAGARTDLDAARKMLADLRTEYTGAARRTDEYREANAQLRVTIRDLRDNLQQKAQAVHTSAQETKAAAQSEKALTAEFNAAVAAARGLSTELGNKNRALDASRTALVGLGITTNNLADTERNLRAAVEGVKQEIQKIEPAYRAAAQASNASTQTQVANQRTLREGMTSISVQLQRIQQIATLALGGSFVGGLLRDVAAVADEYKNLAARIKIATGEGQGFQTAFTGVSEVALRTNSALTETGTLFTRIAKAGTDAGLTSQQAQAQALALTETINQAIQLSGSGADASKAALTQLIQGLQSGVLRGEEFNSVMEQAPRLAQALAQGLNVTTGELRRMAEQGQLTSDTVIRALTKQSDAVASEFGKLPLTVGRALQNLSTQWTLYVGEADKGTASSANVAKIIQALANNIDTLVSVLYAAGKAWAAIKIAGLAADVLRYVSATTAAATATRAATVATTANTAAQVANAAAARATGAAHTSAAGQIVAAAAAAQRGGIVFRGFTGLLGPAGIAVAALAPEIGGLAARIGEAVAASTGWGKMLRENEEKLQAQERATQEMSLAQARANTLLEEARAKQYGISKEAAGLISKFDELKKKGDSAAEAIGKIGRDFDLSTLPGIRDAAAVLDRLVAEGKLSAQEFEAAWATALNGQDLGKFEVQARAAFQGSAREAERLAQVLDANAREAIRRTGLDMSLISGGMSKAAVSAVNDADAIIARLDRLQSQGVDTRRVLEASLTRAIDTADSQRAIDAVRDRIEQVRKALGDRVADGLLDQAKVKAQELADTLDRVKPGINSVSEAWKQLGFTAQTELDKTATLNRQAWDQIKTDATISAGVAEQAFLRYAQSAVDASARQDAATRAATEGLIKAEAAAKGLNVTIDATGKVAVQSFSDFMRTIGGIGPAANDAASGVAKIGAAAQLSDEKAQRLAKTLDDIATRHGQGAKDRAGKFDRPDGKSVTGNTREERLAGQNAVDDTLRLSLEEKLRTRTLTKNDEGAVNAFAAAVAQNEAIARDAAPGALSTDFVRSLDQMRAQVVLMRQALSAGSIGSAAAPGAAPAGPRQQGTTVNINLGGRKRTINTDREGADVLQEILRELADDKGRSS
jgi:tape measure domain-containing protein